VSYVNSAAKHNNVTFSREYATVTNVTRAMSPYTVQANDNHLDVDTSGGSVTLNLAPVQYEGNRIVRITKVTSDANTVTIEAAGTRRTRRLALCRRDAHRENSRRLQRRAGPRSLRRSLLSRLASTTCLACLPVLRSSPVSEHGVSSLAGKASRQLVRPRVTHQRRRDD
jgi:hypothetical protein